MSDMTWLRLVEKASCRRHTHNTTQLRLWYTGQVGDLFGRDAATERDTCKRLELAQPFQACEELILCTPFKRVSTLKFLVRHTWLARC